MGVGRPRIICSPEDMNRELDKIFAYCAMQDPPLFPSAQIICDGLKIHPTSFYDYEKRPEYRPCFEKIKTYCENLLLQKAFQGNGKNTAMDIFLLKQQKFGGYTDVQSTKQDIKVKIDFGGGEKAFK